MENYIRLKKEGKELEIKPPVIASEEEEKREEERKLLISKYEIERCPTCGGEHLVYEGGCLVCKDCGWTECIVS